MKTEEIDKRVAQIGALVGKPSAEAHALEDELFLDVLKAIADGAQNPRKLAAAAIKSADLDIGRWYE